MSVKAVILAAGNSTRTHPVTLNRPKGLLKVANKTVLEHLLTQLIGLVEEVIIVTGYCGERIEQYLGDSYQGLTLHYQSQKEQLGTGNALLSASSYLSGKVIVLMGDDLYARKDLERMLRHRHAILAKEVEDVSAFGSLTRGEGEFKFLKGIKEKTGIKAPGLANTGCYVLDSAVIELLQSLKKSPRGEYEITDALVALAQKENVVVEQATWWVPITYPWSLLQANEDILAKMSKDAFIRDATAIIESGVTLKGNVAIGKNALLRSGTYIEGPVIIGDECDIGPNCHIRPGTAIGNWCRIGNAVEIKNSIIMDHTSIRHLSYVADSVIGEQVNLGAGFIVANMRHDGQDVKSMVKDALLSTGRRKFGTIIGDRVKTGIHTSVYPGRKIWPAKTTLPGEVVKEDKA